MKRASRTKGFTLIELLVVISIIALLSSVVMSSVIKARIRARDTARLQNARQIAIALEQYESTFNTYKVANSGLIGSSGSGYVAKSGGSYASNSILSTLKAAGLYSNTNLTDPVFGDNYYLGLCTSTNAYNVFVKLEQSQYSNSTSSISNTCGGTEASSLGFNFIASTAGGSSSGGGTSSGFGGAYEVGMSAPMPTVTGTDGLTYGTVTAEDGRVWLDRNLGATRVATSLDDYQAYGSKFQWGRATDGHQLINYASAIAGAGNGGSTTTLSTTNSPPNNLYITINSGNNDWRNPQNNSLWQGVSGINNPCPTGYRVPTQPEWANLVTVAGITNNNTAYATTLKLPAPGNRNRSDASLSSLSTYGYYWSSSVSGTTVYYLTIYSAGALPSILGERAYAFSVRCIKD